MNHSGEAYNFGYDATDIVLKRFYSQMKGLLPESLALHFGGAQLHKHCGSLIHQQVYIILGEEE